MMETLRVDHHGRVGLITLNRPQRRNAISLAMVEELHLALEQILGTSIRVVVLTGAGSAFCSGLDLEWLQALRVASDGEAQQQWQRLSDLYQRLFEYPLPTIAAVNGAAMAGGCGLAMVCDMTLAVPLARLGFPENRIGFVPALVGVFLVRLVGEKRARELLLTGRPISAKHAAEWGLISEVVASDMLLERAFEWAEEFLHCSPESVRLTKRLLANLRGTSLMDSLARANQISAVSRRSPELEMGLAAFWERRPPRWD